MSIKHFMMYCLSSCNGRQNNALPTLNVHIQIPRTGEYVVKGKEELRLLTELRLLISWPRDREGILVYPSVPNVINGSL